MTALEAMTIERDQLRQQLTALGLMARSFADVVDERDQARQKLADAPHGDLCNQPEQPCRCWKAGL